MKPAPFAYHRTHSVGEAVALLAELGDEAKILAGGLSLVPMMNFRLARPSALIDVTRVEGLSYLRADNGLRIGALTTHRMVETSRDPAVPVTTACCPGRPAGSGTTRSAAAARSAAASRTRTRPRNGACSRSSSTPRWC